MVRCFLAWETLESHFLTPAAISNRIKVIGQQLLKQHGGEETQIFNFPSQTPMTAVAMVQSESEARLHEKGIILQRDHMRIKVDLVKTPSYACFPGQVRFVC